MEFNIPVNVPFFWNLFMSANTAEAGFVDAMNVMYNDLMRDVSNYYLDIDARTANIFQTHSYRMFTIRYYDGMDNLPARDQAYLKSIGVIYPYEESGGFYIGRYIMDGSDLHDIEYISDSFYDSYFNLHSGMDFEIDNGIVFSYNIFEGDDSVKYCIQTINTPSGITIPVKYVNLLASGIKLTESPLYDNFGCLVYHRRISDLDTEVSYRNKILGLFYLNYKGMREQSLNAALNVLSGLPVSLYGADRINTVVTDGSITTVYTDNTSYILDNTVPISSLIVVGHVLDLFEPFHTVISVDQYNSDETWVDGYEVPEVAYRVDPFSIDDINTTLAAHKAIGGDLYDNKSDLINVFTRVMDLDTDYPLNFVYTDLTYRGEISAASDFPTTDEVEYGWLYEATGIATDYVAGTTNTGLSFQAGDEIYWTGTTWRKAIAPGTYRGEIYANHVRVKSAVCVTDNETTYSMYSGTDLEPYNVGDIITITGCSNAANNITADIVSIDKTYMSVVLSSARTVGDGFDETPVSLDVNTITWIAGNTIRYAFNLTPDLTNFTAGDILRVELAGNTSNNGSFTISTVNAPAYYIEVTNPARSDAVDDEAPNSPAVTLGYADAYFLKFPRLEEMEYGDVYHISSDVVDNQGFPYTNTTQTLTYDAMDDNNNFFMWTGNKNPASYNSWVIRGTVSSSDEFPHYKKVKRGWKFLATAGVTDNETRRTDTGMIIPSGDSWFWYDNIWNRMIYDIGTINVNTDFPLVADVRKGWYALIGGPVTDNAGPTYTNTGNVYAGGELIIWNGVGWVTSTSTITVDYCDEYPALFGGVSSGDIISANAGQYPQDILATTSTGYVFLMNDEFVWDPENGGWLVLTYSGNIAVPGDLPGYGVPTPGDYFRITADVTDNEPNHTNTNVTVTTGERFYWDGVSDWIFLSTRINRGFISGPTGFPTLAVVHPGWYYEVTAASVTDNDPTKTNTGLTFVLGDIIYWTGSTWTTTPTVDQYTTLQEEADKIVYDTPGLYASYEVYDSNGDELPDEDKLRVGSFNKYIWESFLKNCLFRINLDLNYISEFEDILSNGYIDEVLPIWAVYYIHGTLTLGDEFESDSIDDEVVITVV